MNGFEEEDTESRPPSVSGVTRRDLADFESVAGPRSSVGGFGPDHLIALDAAADKPSSTAVVPGSEAVAEAAEGLSCHPVDREAMQRNRSGRQIGWPALLVSMAMNSALLLWVWTREAEHQPPPRKSVQLFLVSPPAAPPPPPPLKGQPKRPVVEAAKPQPERIQAPTVVLPATQPEPPIEEPEGSLEGEVEGDPEGVPGGELGGVIGGELGGVIGGVLGGVPGGQSFDDLPQAMPLSELRLLHKVDPVYPATARRGGVTGMVILEVVVERTGLVGATRVVRSIPSLDEAAISAVSQWRFEPPRRGDTPSRALVTIMVRFDLVA